MSPRPGHIQSLAKGLRANLVSGLIVILPIWLTCQVILAAIEMIEDTLRAVVPGSDGLDARLGIVAWALGLVILALATTVIGYIAKRTVGRQILHFGERQVDRFPVVRSVYGALKQLVVTVFEKSDRSFQQTCLVEFPHDATWAVAVLAGETGAEIPRRTGEPDIVAIFMPTTPNPITGFLFFVPVRDIIRLNMGIEDAAKLIISAGLINPPRSPLPEPDDSERT